MLSDKNIKIIIKIALLIIIVVSVGFVAYGFKHHIFSSQESLTSFLDGFGIWAPLLFILSQVALVVFPIVPGGISLLVGIFLFGAWKGFLYNYIGLSLGSFVAFLVAKHYGTPIIKMFFGQKLRDKYMKWADNEHFPRFFTIAIFMPVAPDDFLCYLAGTTNMKFGRFMITILLGKPIALAVYSFGLNVAFRYLSVLVH